MSDPKRRCIATGNVVEKDNLLRFVTDPDGFIVPDVRMNLPGRGIWITCSRDAVELAEKKGLFARSAKRKVKVKDGLVSEIEMLLRRRCLDLLGLSRKSGDLVVGFAKVEKALKTGKAAVLIAGKDGSEDGRKKLRNMAGKHSLIEFFTIDELSRSLGRDNVVHAMLARNSGLAKKFLAETEKLAGFVVLAND